MNSQIKIAPLSKDKFSDAVNVVLNAQLDTREEIEHHLKHIDAHYIAIDNDKVVGVIGWYQDNVNYAKLAMGSNFPGEEEYWVGFFAVDKGYRGKGIGSALLNKLEEILKDKNVKELWVSSVPKTKTYYENHGFRLIKEGKIGGNKKFFMVKNL